MSEEFLEADAGIGFDNVAQDDRRVPLLLVSQALSQVVDSGEVPVGHFYNSSTGEDYGTSLKMVVCNYDRAWYEWRDNQEGLNAVYPVNGVEVTGDRFTGMRNALTNLKIEEKMLFWVVLPEHPDAGMLLFSSTPGTMKYMKQWLSSMMAQRLPSGKPAPIYARVWELTLNKIKNKNSNTYYAPANESGKSSARVISTITQETYTAIVQPSRQQAITMVAGPNSVPQLEDHSTEF